MRRFLIATLPPLLMLIFMLWPLAIMVTAGITLTGMAEESVGYRYFYTLRILYADHERPWLPQAQLVGLTHLGIQLLLTAAGYPPEQLFPRIDLFAYAASALPSVLTAVAFVWAVRPLRDPLARLLVALLLLVTVFDVRNGRGLHLIQADYYTWVHIVALITIGGVLRAVKLRLTLDLRSGLVLGLFTAASLTIKPTHLIFILPVALILLCHAVQDRQWGQAILGAVVAAAVAMFGVFVITWAYYLGDLAATGEYFVRLATFVDAVTASAPFVEWLNVALRYPQQQVNPLAVGVLLVPVLALSAIVLPNRLVSLCLLPGALASVYLSWRRFYSNTLIETNDYTFVMLVLWGALVATPFIKKALDRVAWSGPDGKRRWVTPLSLGGLVLALWLGVRLADDVQAANETHLASFSSSSVGARELDAYLKGRPGRVLFLIPENSRRPTTVDSAIYKGGMDIHDSTWGVSPYIAGLFPERSYNVGRPADGKPVDLAPFSRVVFVSVPVYGGDADAYKQLLDYFQVTLTEFSCDFRVDLRHHEVVACERLR